MRVNILVNNILLMDRLQCIGELNGNLQAGSYLDRPTIDRLPQRHTGKIFLNEGERILIFFQIVGAENARAIQGLGDGVLMLQPCDILQRWVFFTQLFDGNRALIKASSAIGYGLEILANDFANFVSGNGGHSCYSVEGAVCRHWALRNDQLKSAAAAVKTGPVVGSPPVASSAWA